MCSWLWVDELYSYHCITISYAEIYTYLSSSIKLRWATFSVSCFSNIIQHSYRYINYIQMKGKWILLDDKLTSFDVVRGFFDNKRGALLSKHTESRVADQIEMPMPTRNAANSSHIFIFISGTLLYLPV